MSSAEQSRQAKIISELRVFIRKVLSEPAVATTCFILKNRGSLSCLP